MGAIRRLSLTLQRVKDALPTQTRKLETYYEILDKIGSGSSGEVRLARRKDNGKFVALKMIRRVRITEEEIQNEIQILRKHGRHEGIGRLIEVFDQGKVVVLVMDYLNGGTLWDYIKKKGVMKESEVVPIMKDIFEALAYLHSNGVAHRDIKPQNMLMHKSRDGTRTTHLIDFGFATRDGDSSMSLACGSLPYAAPELLAGKGYSKNVDVWSAGILLYTMLLGTTPYNQVEKTRIKSAIANGQIEYPEDMYSKLSIDAQDILSRMLTLDPSKRWSAAQILRHPWLQSEGRVGSS